MVSEKAPFAQGDMDKQMLRLEQELELKLGQEHPS